MTAPAARPSTITTAAAFATVFARLKPRMSRLDAFLRAQLSAFEPEIRDMADYCIDTSGKRIRPALVFLSGWNDSDPSDDATPAAVSTHGDPLVRAAAVVELVHLATLVHDDIMDEADVRRSRPTAARKYGAEAAVLLGDALLAHAVYLASQFPTTEVCAAVSESTRKVCAGEIVQTLRRGTIDVTRADYDRIIDLKTAELFRVSCLLGARLSGHPGFAPAAATFGRKLGIAYQIYDDLADFFGQENRIGKTLGTDLASGKITLPLLFLAEKLSPAERETLHAEITGQRPPDLSARLRQMQEHGIFEQVAAALAEETSAAREALAPHAALPPVRHLLELCDVLHAQVAALRQ